MSDDLVKRLRRWQETFGKPIGNGRANPDNDMIYLLGDAAASLAAKDAEIERLRGEVYVPGSWHCAKCKFTLLQSNLNARDGTVTPRDKPGDKCPNCNSPLWRATWKQDAFEMQERAVEQMERAKAAESRAEQAERALAEALSVVESLLLSLGNNNSDRVKAARRFMKEHTP